MDHDNKLNRAREAIARSRETLRSTRAAIDRIRREAAEARERQRQQGAEAERAERDPASWSRRAQRPPDPGA